MLHIFSYDALYKYICNNIIELIISWDIAAGKNILYLSNVYSVLHKKINWITISLKIWKTNELHQIIYILDTFVVIIYKVNVIYSCKRLVYHFLYRKAVYVRQIKFMIYSY